MAYQRFRWCAAVRRGDDPADKKKDRKGARRFGIAAGVFFGVLLVVYLAGAFVFMGRFFPNTAVSGLDISMKSPEEVGVILDDAVGDYKLVVTGQGLNFLAERGQIGMTLDSTAISEG